MSSTMENRSKHHQDPDPLCLTLLILFPRDILEAARYAAVLVVFVSGDLGNDNLYGYTVQN
jgi:hypothetical protein